MISHFLGAALVAAPFFLRRAPITTPNLSQDFFFLLLTFVAAIIFGIKEINHRISVLVIATTVMAFSSPNPFGIFHFYQLSMILAGVTFIAFLFSNRARINFGTVSKYLGAVCVLESGYIILQYFGTDIYAEFSGLKSETKNGITTFGSLGNPNHSGALVACLIPFLPWFLYPVAVIALYLSGSAMPVICAVVAVSVFLLIRAGKSKFIPIIFACLILLAALLVLGFFDRSFLSDTHRVKVWMSALNEIGFTVAGKGIAWAPTEFTKISFNGIKFYHLHNEWLELYSMGGLLAVATSIYFLLPALTKLRDPKTSAALLAALINSLGNFTFHIAPLFMVFAVCYVAQFSEET